MPAQLAPFNEHQFDRCMLWFAAKHGPLTQYDMVKLHVMTDVFHVLDHGTPVIGGELKRWKLGPAVHVAYRRVMRWARLFEQGHDSGLFEITQEKENIYSFSAPEGAFLDEDEFSPSEIRAMQAAWQAIGELDFSQSQRFFHDPAYFMGKAWADAGEQDSPVDWAAVIDAYDEKQGQNHSHIKALIALGV